MNQSSTLVPAEIFKQVRRIEITTRKLVNEIFSGQYSSVFKGRGMEFSQVREYQPGDDPKLIDWNVTARTGQLFTKEFMEERELTVMILMDASRSLFFGSHRSLKSEMAAELAAVLSFSAIRNNDKVGLVIFTDRIERYFPPCKGQRTILRLIREILTFKPQGHTTDLSVGMEFLGKVLKRKAICFLMSDFLASGPYEKPLQVLSKKHDLIAVKISDRSEKKIPISGSFAFRDIESDHLGILKLRDFSDCEEMEKGVRKRFLEWKKMMDKNRVDVIEATTGEPYAASLLSFFKSRARRFR